MARTPRMHRRWDPPRARPWAAFLLFFVFTVIALALGTTGCGGDDVAILPEDGGNDGTAGDAGEAGAHEGGDAPAGDASFDVGIDASLDAMADVGSDATLDATSDGEVDATDATPDVTSDAAEDAASDVLPDIAPESGNDGAGNDGGEDGTADAFSDATTDGPSDAEDAGPFDFTVTLPVPVAQGTFPILPAETRDIAVDVTLVSGAPAPVGLTLLGLPAGTTGTFMPASVTPTGSSVLSITTSATTPLGDYTVTVEGSSGALVHTASFTLEVRSPNVLSNAVGLAIESGGATALVSEQRNAGGSFNGDVVRVDATTKAAIKTIASGLTNPRDLALESGGGTALVAGDFGLARVDVTSGAVTTLTATAMLLQAYGVAIEAGGASAIVSDCGPASFCANGRVSRVTLATGNVVVLTPGSSGITQPASLAIEPGGATALLAERGGTGRLLRVDLTTGVLLSVADGEFNAVFGVAIESGGASAILTINGGRSDIQQCLVRVTLATGVPTILGCEAGAGLLGIAIESGGTSALGADVYGAVQRVARFSLVSPVAFLTPARQSAVTLMQPSDLALLNGTTAMVTDAGPSFGKGRLSRVDLVAGTVTPIATALANPHGVAIEGGGATALVVDHSNPPLLLRVNLAGGAVTTVATLSGPNSSADGIAIEAGGATALVAVNGELARVTLATGVVTRIASACSGEARGVEIEAGGAAALVVCQQQLVRVDLATGTVTALTVSLFVDAWAVAVEAGGTTALVGDRSVGSLGVVWQVNLGTGAVRDLGGRVGHPNGVVIEASGSALVLDGNPSPSAAEFWAGSRLLRVTPGLTPPFSSVAPLLFPRGLALESSGTSALVLDCVTATSPCSTAGRLSRVTLASGTLVPIVSTLDAPASVAPEAGGATALVTDSARLLRVTLANGAVGAIATGLNNPGGIAVESGGGTALVAETGANRLVRVNTSSGALTVVATGLATPGQVQIESSGATALLTASNGLVRVDLTTGAVSTIYAAGDVQSFAIEASGNTALVFGSFFAWPDALVRVNLTTGGKDMTVLALFGAPNTAVLTSGGTPTAYFTQSTAGGGQAPGGLYSLQVP